MGPVLNGLIIFFSIVIQVFIPGFLKEILLIESGILFGVFWGSLLNWLSMICAAQVGYEVMRYSVERGGKLSVKIEKFQSHKYSKKLQNQGNYGLFLIRLIPTAPHDILSLVAGWLLLDRLRFFLVSIITFLPSAILFAYVGSLGSDYVSTKTLFQINLIIGLGILMAFIVFNFIIERNRVNDKENDTEN